MLLAYRKSVYKNQVEIKEKRNYLVMKNGKVILNGQEIPLVWNYELIKKTVPISEENNNLTDETVLKLEIIIDGDVAIINS